MTPPLSEGITALTPDNVAVPASGLMTGTLGRAELEVIASYVVHFHHVHGLKEWSPIKLSDFTAMGRTDPVIQGWFENVIWLKCLLDGFHEFVDDEWITGWVNGDPDSVGTVAPKFIQAIEGSHWDLRERAKIAKRSS